MTQKQTCIRFEHPCGTLSSSRWRQELQAKGVLPENVVVFQSSSALSITATTAGAGQQLQDGALGLMRAVATTAGRTLAVDMLELTPAIAFTGYRWRYSIPCMAVARSGDDWAPWREEELSQSYSDKMRDRIAADLIKQLAAWGLEPQNLAIELVNAGTPMVLKNAVANGPKPTSAMGRKGVVFSSTVRMEGAFWVGLLQATGHGRLFREGHEATQP